MAVCLDPHDPKAQYLYCPSFGAAILFSVLFGIVTLLHIVQAILYRKRFCWVIIMAGLWETAAFIMRDLSTQNQTSEGLYIPQQLLILLAPLWINAFDYMVLGRMVYYFLPDRKVLGIGARRLALCFVLLDITAFLMQGAGGSMSSNTDPQSAMLGIHIYMGGIGLQEIFILLFLLVATTFHRKMKKERHGGTDWRSLLYVLYASLVLITVRIIFRLVEFSSGFYSTVPTHEAFFYCFDSLPMLAALVLFNFWHPGKVLTGPESEFSKKGKKNKKDVESGLGAIPLN